MSGNLFRHSYIQGLKQCHRDSCLSASLSRAFLSLASFSWQQDGDQLPQADPCTLRNKCSEDNVSSLIMPMTILELTLFCSGSPTFGRGPIPEPTVVSRKM